MALKRAFKGRWLVTGGWGKRLGDKVCRMVPAGWHAVGGGQERLRRKRRSPSGGAGRMGVLSTSPGPPGSRPWLPYMER